MCCSKGIAKCILFLFNIIFWLTGAALLAIGIWMKVDKTIVRYLLVLNISQTDPLIDHAAWLFIGVGGFTFIVGFLGCCGAIRESQCMLFCYAALLMIVMVAELVGAILALIYRQKIEKDLHNSMMDQVKNKYMQGTNSSSVTRAWDFLQNRLSCCGAENYTDYYQSQWWNDTRKMRFPPDNIELTVPVTCCKLKSDDIENPEAEDLKTCQDDAKMKRMTSEQLHTQGCHPALHKWFKKHSLIFMCIGFGIAAIQILGFALACCLRTAIKRESTKEFA